MKVAHVKWFDASFHDGPDYVESLEPGIEVESAGILVASDDKHVTIVGDWWEGHPSARCRHIHHIPKVNIIEMHVIDVTDMKLEAS